MIAGINLLDIAKISPVFDILVLCSMVALAAALQRFLVYKNQSLDVSPFMEKIKALVGKGQYTEAVEICNQTSRPLSNMIKVGLENMELGRKNVSDLMEAQKLLVREGLERYLPILGTLGNSAPFIGLLGTVIGIIRAFKLLESAESMGPTAIMIGIAEALVTTAMGLIVAVPCVILFNWFMERVKGFFLEMETASKEFITLMPQEEESAPQSEEVMEELVSVTEEEIVPIEEGVELPESRLGMLVEQIRRKLKKAKKVDFAPPITEINVTPLVDICLVLVIIFLTFAPLIYLSGISISRGKTEEKQTEIAYATELKVNIHLTADGHTILNKKIIDDKDSLNYYLHELLLRGSRRMATISADPTVKHSKVINILDMATNAGAVSLCIVKRANPLEATGVKSAP